VIRIKLEVST